MLRRAAQALGPLEAQLVAWVEHHAGGPAALGPNPPLPARSPTHGLGLVSPPSGYDQGGTILALPVGVWGPVSAQFALDKAQATAPTFYETLCALDQELGRGQAKLLQPVALATHVVLALLDTQDHVHPYAHFLYQSSQRGPQHPLLLTSQELRQALQASPVVAAIEKRQQLYAHVHARLFGDAAALPRPLFLWALSCVLSRAVSGGGKPLTLLPYFDLLNHRQDANCAYMVEAGGTVLVKATRRVAAGEELYLCYNDKDNHQFLMTYGFVDEANPRKVHLQVQEETGAGTWALDKLAARGGKEAQTAILRQLQRYGSSLEADRAAARTDGKHEPWRRTALALLIEEKTCMHAALARVSSARDAPRPRPSKQV